MSPSRPPPKCTEDPTHALDSRNRSLIFSPSQALVLLCSNFQALHPYLIISLGSPCCSSVSFWTSHESDLTLSADFEFVEVSPGEPGSPGSSERQECYSRCRNERRLVNGRARGVRYECTSEHWTVDTRVCFCSLTLGVASKVTPGMDAVGSWFSTSKWTDASAGDTPSLTPIDTVKSLRRLDLYPHNESSS